MHATRSNTFSTFVNKLSVVHEHDSDEWEAIKAHLAGLSQDPGLFWYPSCGKDRKALLHFNPAQCRDTFRTPVVDVFFFSDYRISQLLKDSYDNVESMANIPLEFKDDQTKMELDSMIPLRYFSDEALQSAIVEQEKDQPEISQKLHGPMMEPDQQFYYCEFTITHQTFGVWRVPVFYSTGETWFLAEQVFRKENLQFDYICGVTDGCAKGGGYQCMNALAGQFGLVVKKPGAFWVTDHLEWKHTMDPSATRMQRRGPIHRIRGWGGYGDSTAIYPYAYL